MNRNDYNEKLIYKIYKEFFDKEPNFSKENIRNVTIEIQAMLYILNGCGVLFFEDSFVKSNYKGLDLPMSMNVQDIIVGQLVDNYKDLNDASLHFTKITEKLIGITGSVIRDSIKDTRDQIEALRLIACILYVKKNVYPNTDEDEIKQLTNCELEDLNIEEEAIDIITNELCKNNFDENNVENIRKMIDESPIDTYSMFMDESGDGKHPVITKANRKSVVRSLLR